MLERLAWRSGHFAWPGLFALLVIPLGLAILAKEFPWARKLLDKIKEVRWRLTARALQVLGKAPRPAGPGVFLTDAS